MDTNFSPHPPVFTPLACPFFTLKNVGAKFPLSLLKCTAWGRGEGLGSTAASEPRITVEQRTVGQACKEDKKMQQLPDQCHLVPRNPHCHPAGGRDCYL